MTYRILVTTAVTHEYARNPLGEVFLTEDIREAEAFAELFYLGRPGVLAVSYTREAWPIRAARMREDLRLGLPLGAA